MVTDTRIKLKTGECIIKSEIFWLSLLLGITILLATPRLESYPRLSFDEGWRLQLAKNLALYGEYALANPPQESDWFFVNSSPTLVLPIALSFKLLGVGVVQGRIVPALYLIAAMLAVYLYMRHLYGWPTAALSAVLFLTAGPAIEFNTISQGRRVLGEIPALFFILLGAWTWFRSWEHNSIRQLISAGLLFGLAFTTKEQFIPLVVPLLGLVWLADRVYYRKLRMRHLIVPILLCGVPLGIWYGYQLSILGLEAFTRHLNRMSEASRASTWLFAPSTWPGHIGFLYANSFLLLGLPGILYTLALSARPDQSSLKSLFLPILAIELLVWFVFLSIGWWRYAYPGLALSTLLAAKPLSDLIVGLSLAPARLWTGLREGKMARAIVAAIVATLVIGYPLQNFSRQVLFKTDRSAQEFAIFVETHTERNALIELFDWEVDFLTTRRYHHPPVEVFIQLLRNDPTRTYDPLVYRPKYIIDGPYSKGTNLYPASWLRQCCQIIGSIGNYDLYAVMGGALP